MGDLSSFFHVFSLLAFISLSFVVLKLKAELKIWRDWNSGAGSDKVTVGTPIRVLRRFAAAIGAGFESEVADNSLSFRQLRLDACFNLHRTVGIRKILVTKPERARVDFVLVREASIMPVDLDQIRRELGDGIDVGVSTGRQM